jgi:DNA invertase Pin-like site-specific DNA recombinase
MKNVIQLIRVSTESQAGEDRAGIPAQREANQRTAKTYGLNIVKTVEIVDVSGSAVLCSPQMQHLLEMIESPEIRGVVTKEFSRLIRPEKFTDFALLQHFIDTQTVLYLPDGPIDLQSKTGRLLGTIRAAMAGMERREILERMQDAKESMRRAGKHAGGANSLPYGVAYSETHGWQYTAEAEKVRQTFALFLGGEMSYTTISTRLNIPRTNVRFILQNPIYTGWRVYDEKRDPSPQAYVPAPDGRQGYRRKTKRPIDEVIRVRVLPPIVSEEDFDTVRRFIELKRQKHWRSRADTPRRYIYNGFLTCGDCDSLLYTHTSKSEFYHCKSVHPRERKKRALVGQEPCGNRYMLRRKLEPKLDILLGEKLRDSDFLHRLADDYTESQTASRVRSAVDEDVVVTKLASLEQKRQRVLEAFFEGIITKEERDRRIADIERDVSTYRPMVTESGSRQQPPLLSEIESVLEPFADWEFLERDDKRALLAMICPEICVFRYSIKSLVLNLGARAGGGYEGNRSKTGRLPSPARPSPSRFHPDSCWPLR